MAYRSGNRTAGLQMRQAGWRTQHAAVTMVTRVLSLRFGRICSTLNGSTCRGDSVQQFARRPNGGRDRQLERHRPRDCAGIGTRRRACARARAGESTGCGGSRLVQSNRSAANQKSSWPISATSAAQDRLVETAVELAADRHLGQQRRRRRAHRRGRQLVVRRKAGRLVAGRRRRHAAAVAPRRQSDETARLGRDSQHGLGPGGNRHGRRQRRDVRRRERAP